MATKTHDTSDISSHVKDIETFMQDLNTSLQGIKPRCHSECVYTDVHVLACCWEDDKLGCLAEVEELQNTFRECFSFSVEDTFRIPIEDSHNRTQERVTEFKRLYSSKSSLLIFYYGGHGGITDDGDCVWGCYDRADAASTAPSVDWYEIQSSVLERSASDVLVILDCCYASSARRGFRKGAIELLAACGWETWTPGVGLNSFTHALIRELKALSSGRFSTWQLYTRIFTSLKQKECRKIKTPIHVPLTDDRRRNIELTPLRLPSTQMASSLCTSIADIDLSTTPSEDNPQALLTINLEDDQYLNRTDFEEWYRQFPARISSIKVYGVFKSDSTLLVISMPIMLWDSLRDDPAYRFIMFIKSENFLDSLQRSKEGSRDKVDHFTQRAPSRMSDSLEESLSAETKSLSSCEEVDSDSEGYVLTRGDIESSYESSLEESDAETYTPSDYTIAKAPESNSSNESPIEENDAFSHQFSHQHSYVVASTKAPNTPSQIEELDAVSYEPSYVAITERPQLTLSSDDYHDEYLSKQGKLRKIWDEQIINVDKGSWHQNVAVMLICWDEEMDDLHTGEEVQALEDVFRDTYNFKVFRHHITDKNGMPTVQLHKSLADFVYEEDGERTLLIVYYAGHANLGGKPGQLTLAGHHDPWKEKKNNEIIWDTAEGILDTTMSDVLVIFDCCHAGNLGRSTIQSLGPSRWPSRWSSRCSEFLAATGASSLTAAPGPKSFTSSLIWALHRLANDNPRGFTTSELRRKITESPHFPRRQVPVLSERNGSASVRHIIVAPLLSGDPTLKSKSEACAEEQLDNIEYLDIRFLIDKRLEETDIKRISKAFNDLVRNQDLNIRQAVLLGQYSTNHKRDLIARAAKKWIECTFRNKTGRISTLSPGLPRKPPLTRSSDLITSQASCPEQYLHTSECREMQSQENTTHLSFTSLLQSTLDRSSNLV